jgi:hypothetical protein
MKKICNIASIIPGHQFRAGVSDDPGGDSRVLQVKDISRLKEMHQDKNNTSADERKAIDFSMLDRVDGRKIRKECFARKDDILFVYRGESNSLFQIRFDPHGLVIPNYFFLIRVTDTSVHPAYLYWYLQQKPAKRQIEKARLGSRVSMISREGLSEIEIPLPALERQKQIAEFGALMGRELELLNRINLRKYALREKMLIENTITAGA